MFLSFCLSFLKGSEFKELNELYYFKDSKGAPVIVSDTDPLPIGDVNVGDKADTAVTDPTLSASEIALLKGLVKILSDVWDDTSNTTKVTLQQVEGAIDSAVPTKAAFVGGKYSSADPSYHDGDLTPVRTNEKGEVLTQLTGSNMELFGATIASRPAANTVPVGATFMAVDTQEIWQSNGTDWVVLA